jgi:hypothetical protein
MSRRVPISRQGQGRRKETILYEAGRDTGRPYVLPREALLIWRRGCYRRYKTKPTRRPQSGEGEEGGMIRGTFGSLGTLMTRGLRSIGNSVEEKTPATEKQEEVVIEAKTGEPIIYGGQHTT